MTQKLEGHEIRPLEVVDHQNRGALRRYVTNDRYHLLEEAELCAAVGQDRRDEGTAAGLVLWEVDGPVRVVGASSNAALRRELCA